VATDHPLLELQQQAGNAAVSRLLAMQRHSLDPEEEPISGRTRLRQPGGSGARCDVAGAVSPQAEDAAVAF
jgi:hypothetical protein